LSESLQSQHTERNCFKKFADTLKKLKTLTYEPTEKKESKMTMPQKLNKDNGLQDWMTEHQVVTGGIFYC
jgi:hypothetical protein